MTEQEHLNNVVTQTSRIAIDKIMEAGEMKTILALSALTSVVGSSPHAQCILEQLRETRDFAVAGGTTLEPFSLLIELVELNVTGVEMAFGGEQS